MNKEEAIKLFQSYKGPGSIAIIFPLQGSGVSRSLQNDFPVVIHHNLIKKRVKGFKRKR